MSDVEYLFYLYSVIFKYLGSLYQPSFINSDTVNAAAIGLLRGLGSAGSYDPRRDIRRCQRFSALSGVSDRADDEDNFGIQNSCFPSFVFQRIIPPANIICISGDLVTESLCL